MGQRSFISGMGIISAIGNDVESNLSSLISKQSGIENPKLLGTQHKDFLCGEVKLSNDQLAQELDADPTHSRTLLLGMKAALETIDNANLSKEYLESTLFFNGTSVGGMDKSEWAYKGLTDGTTNKFAREFNTHDCGEITRLIASQIGLNSNVYALSTACSSAANAILLAGRFIRAGIADRIIAGGSDALSVFTLNGFNSLRILDPDWCKPFDANRNGLNLGEGAAYLLIESERSLAKRSAEPIAELVGFGNANDAYHQTASSPEGKGATKAITKAIESLSTELNIDYVNTHGTGTVNNDESESNALKKVFGPNSPPYSSTKAYTGHALASAGSLEAVFSILSIKNQTVFPALNVSKPMDILPNLVLEPEKKKLRQVLSNSFGFGGNCTSLIFQSV